MVQFHPDAHPTFRTLDQMETELKTIFDRDIDLITRQGIETSRNYLRRHEILSSFKTDYGSISWKRRLSTSTLSILMTLNGSWSAPLLER